MTENPCECKDPGFCLRYNRQMNQRLHQICQGEVLTPEKCEAYRQFWLSQRKTGLGDVVHTIAKVTGAAAVAKAVSKVTGKDCGCTGRQKRLNQATIRTPIDRPWMDEEYADARAKLLAETEVLVKSFRRHELLLRFLLSVRQYYPGLAVRVVDDSGVTTKNAEKIKQVPGVSWHDMEFDSGLPAGRNLAVRESSAKYVIVCDDDFLFTEDTDLFAMLFPLERTDLDLCGGLVRWQGKDPVNWCGTLRFEGVSPNRTLVMQRDDSPLEETPEGVAYRRTDITFNFFAARRESLLKHPWDERYKIGDEHLDSFLEWKEAGLKVAYTTASICSHLHSNNKSYKNFRKRANTASLNEKWGIKERKTLAVTRFPGM